jgi:hypothetical protein
VTSWPGGRRRRPLPVRCRRGPMRPEVAMLRRPTASAAPVTVRTLASARRTRMLRRRASKVAPRYSAARSHGVFPVTGLSSGGRAFRPLSAGGGAPIRRGMTVAARDLQRESEVFEHALARGDDQCRGLRDRLLVRFSQDGGDRPGDHLHLDRLGALTRVAVGTTQLRWARPPPHPARLDRPRPASSGWMPEIAGSSPASQTLRSGGAAVLASLMSSRPWVRNPIRATDPGA